MNVLHILPDHDLGGGAVNTARLIRALGALDRPETHVAMLPQDASAPMRACFADLPHVFGAYPGRGAPHRIARAALAQAAPGDVLHGQGTRAAVGAMLAGALRPSLRTVYTVRGFHGLAQPGPFGIRAKLEKLLARRIHATVFVSHADAALAAAAGLRHRGRTEVIGNGIETPPVAPDAPRPIDILFVGRMVTQKWPQAMVETLALLPGAGTPAAPRAVLVGAGEMAAEIDGMIAAKGLTNVERLDGLPSDATLALMAQARVLVMTSLWEGLPTVAIEAAQSRALVAGFSIPPLAEVLEGMEAETLTPPDPAALAARLGALLGDEPRRRALAEALHDRARDRYAPARLAARYGALYDRIAGSIAD